MEDATAKAAPFDIRYQYISGAIADGGPCTSCAANCTSKGAACDNQHGCGWWGCWQYDQDPPGQFVRDFVTKAEAAGEIPMFDYYMVLQASGVDEGAPEVGAMNDTNFMKGYLADFRFLLKQIGTHPALVHIEPDFWGYAEQIGKEPAQIPAAVAIDDCSEQPQTLVGVAQCMIALTRTYAPHAKVGLHASDWGTEIDVFANKDASLDVSALATKQAAFFTALGVNKADFLAVDALDRDTQYYESMGQARGWDATNKTLPNFTQALSFVGAVAQQTAMPVIWWQTPVGNAQESGGTDHWRDNRVDYFFHHASELAASGAFAAVFGAGATGQTTPESDGGVLVSTMKTFAATGGQALCK